MTPLATAFTYRCGLTVPNRMALAPLTNTQSHPDGTLAEDELAWLLARGAGGWGLVSTCAAFVSAQGHAWRGQLGIATDAHLPGLTRLASALRKAGAQSIVQLHHGGMMATLATDRISADDVPEREARAATDADLEQVIADFVAAARRAEAAGFAGVEVHGANGYLLTQFLAPGTNHRADRWGGALENRARLTRAVVRAVRGATSPGFLVGVRLSPVDVWSRRGLVLADSLKVGRWVAEDGADFVHLSLMDAAGTAPHEDDPRVVVTAFRAALPAAVAVHVAGGIWTAEDALVARAEGADVVVVGRAAIAHPNWAQRVLTPGFEPTRPPWTPASLRAVAVGDAFIEYLSKFPDMVVGGRSGRPTT